MKSLVTILLLAFVLPSIGQTNVSPEAWLALQSRPNFKSGTKFPKLSRYGWPWTFELEREIATNWGFYIGVNGSASLDSSNGLASALSNTNSVTYKVVTLASNFPATYQLQLNLERNWPTNMSRGFFVTNAAGNFTDATTNEWADWTNSRTKIVSPEAADSDLQIQASAITGPLKMLAGMAPIGIVINGGERDLGVSAHDFAAWAKDPRVQATAVVTNAYDYLTNNTGMSRPRYSSYQKARHLRVLSSEVGNSITNSWPLYVWYNSGYEFYRINQPGHTWENGLAVWGWLSTNLINLSSNAALPVASSEVYYINPNSFTNATGVAWNNYTALLTHQLQWCGYIQGLGWRTNYTWITGGWSNTDTNRLSDLSRYMGLLKMLTVSGSVGFNVGYYEFPTNTTPGSIFGNGGFGGSFPSNSPPHWLQQLVTSSRVHAFSTHLDDFVLNSWLLSGNGAHFASTDAASCEFTNTIADPTLRVIARRRDNRPEWLVGAWASYGDARDATINLTDYGPLTVNARPEGSVYWVTPDTVRLLDVDTTDPSQGVQTPDVIPSYRRYDWANYTGIPGGIPTNRTTVFTNMTGLDNTGATDVSAAVNAALAACPSNQVVYIPAGTFLVTNQIWVPGGVTLRGAGKTSTIFSLQRPAARSDGGIRLGTSADLGASSTWTNAGLAVAGSTNLTLLTATGLAVGNIVVIEQMNDTNLVFNYSQDGSSGSQDYHATTSLTNYCVAQLIKVLSISGTNITFEPPLTTTFTNALNCRLFRRGSSNWPRLATLESCQVTTPTNKFTTSWQRNIQIAFADEAGMKDVFVNGYERYGLYLSSAYRCTIQDCDFIGTNLGGSGGNYAIGLVFGSAFNRIENNWTSNAITAVVIAEMAQGNAILYNFEAANYYSPTNWLQPGSSVHDCHPMFNLYEGNVFGMVGADMSHGNARSQTYFRNRLYGWQPGKTSQNRAAFIDYGHFDYNLVGNVMGGPWLPYKSFANGPEPSEMTSLTNVLLLVGYSTGDGDGPLGQTYTNSFGHTNVYATMLLKGNYIAGATDTTNGIPADQIVPTLENSLVYESKPAYFGGLTWPPVNPSSPTTNYHALLIPAQYRYTGTEIPDDPQPPPPEQGGQTFRSVRMNVGTLLFK